MKKVLEVHLDDNGEMHISAEDFFPDLAEPDCEKKADHLFRSTIKALTKLLWEKQDLRVSKAIRLLSMSEMACDRQPYQHVDQFFFTMMDSFLPQYEKFCNKLKAPYGFRSKELIKPFSMGDTSCMQLPDYPFRNKNIINDPTLN